MISHIRKLEKGEVPFLRSFSQDLNADFSDSKIHVLFEYSTSTF